MVIVGGRLTGCSIAYHLAHLGWTDVVLLEQHRLTAGTTWHAAGLITSAGMTDETALFFSRYSRDLYARLEARDGEVVTVTDVTFGTTLLTVQGPASRELIGRLTDADPSNDAFAYLTARPIHVGYAPVLAIRVTYVGELGWELHVPAEYAAGAYDDLAAAGGDLGFLPVGLQAMSSLRLEKGYREREQGPPRHRVVSLIVDDPAADPFGNEPVLAGGEWAGYVRAAAYGHTVGGPVGLAQVACDDGVTGQWLKEGDFRVRTPDGEVPARLQIAPPYDPQRLRILDR